MSVHFNPTISSLNTESLRPGGITQQSQNSNGDFRKAIQNSLNKVNEHQTDANQSIVELLAGKQQDVNTVVADMAKADMSFKLLVGVRNKLVEAYKETMRMQI